MSIYLDGATVEECRDALRRGVPIEQLASRLRVAPDVLQALMSLHPLKVRVAVSDSDELDLWGGCDRLEEVL